MNSSKQDLAPLPADFIWGVSASGYQSEGGDVQSNWDRYNPQIAGNDPYGRSIDFRHRYREDVALARGMGVNTFRIGINWARVEQRRGAWEEAELAYYDDLVNSICEAGMRPLITLDHFVYPGWVLDQDGWCNPQTLEDFMRFVRMVVQRYHRQVSLWLTFNEAAFFMLIEMKMRKLSFAQLKLMKQHIIGAHRQAYDHIHEVQPQALVSSNIVWCGRGPFSWLLQKYSDGLFLNHVGDKLDCVSFDYYYGGVGKALLTQRLWEAPPTPSGLGRALRILARRYPKLPILIAENGMPTLDAQPRADGIRREDVLRDCVYWTQRLRAEGVNVIGYMYWSLTDNFEWGKYGPRFGLYTVDVLTDPELRRIPTAAVEAYRQLIRGGGVAAGYRPVLD